MYPQDSDEYVHEATSSKKKGKYSVTPDVELAERVGKSSALPPRSAKRYGHLDETIYCSAPIYHRLKGGIPESLKNALLFSLSVFVCACVCVIFFCFQISRVSHDVCL